MRRLLMVLGAALTLPGCAAPLPANTASPLFGGGFAVGPATSPAPGPFDGLYAGTAVVELNMDLACAQRIPVGGFLVDGSQVRFGGFRGTVRPDGSTTLQFGQSVTTGRFAGGQFTGQMTLYSGLINLREFCIYRLALSRNAA